MAIEPRPTLEPLVEPGAELTREEIARYSRHLLIPEFGMIAQRRLKNANILVIGAGGLGSPAMLYLAAAGVGTLGILDDDVVDVSNLQRQVIHGVSDVGRSKGESARDTVRELNPLVDVVLHQVRLDRDNALDLFAGYDLILDGTDNFATRYLVNDAAAILGKPYVWGSILRFDGQVSVFWAGRGPTYRDLHPEAPPAGSVPSCAEGGVLGVLCAQIGSVMVNEAIKLVTGIGQSLLGRVLIFDALAMTWREIRVRPDPTAQPVTELIDYEAFCGMAPSSAAQPEGAAPGLALQEISVRELTGLLSERAAGNRDFDLIDVRDEGEYAIVHIDGARLVPQTGILSGSVNLMPEREVYVHCKSGARSAGVARFLQAAGHSKVFNVTGGIEEWVRQVEPDKQLY